MSQVNERKLEIARAQLGTALQLFLLNRDPHSVHALACGGCELIEGLADSAQLPTLTTHITKTKLGWDKAKVVRTRTTLLRLEEIADVAEGAPQCVKGSSLGARRCALILAKACSIGFKSGL